MPTTKDPYLSTTISPRKNAQYSISQSPYAPSSTTLSELHAPSQSTPYSNPSTSSSSDYTSRFSPNRFSPGPSTSGLSNRQPLISSTNTTLFTRRNSSTDLYSDRRGSLTSDPLVFERQSSTAGKRKDSLTDRNAAPSSIKESWASGYLRRRKEVQKEDEEETLAPSTSDKASVSKKPQPLVVKIPVKEPPPLEDIQIQKEFMARLMAAHSKVDELLSKRGLRTENETKFIHHLEWVPVIEEDLTEERISPRIIRHRRRQTVSPHRSTSSENDSGMESTDSTGDNERLPTNEESPEHRESIEETDAGECIFTCKAETNEIFEICALLNSVDTSASINIKREKRTQQPAKSKSTKKLVRQKTNIEEEITELHVKLPAKPKSTKKLVPQNVQEVTELRIRRKLEEESPLQLAFSKCAIARCKVKEFGETVTETIKLVSVVGQKKEEGQPPESTETQCTSLKSPETSQEESAAPQTIKKIPKMLLKRQKTEPALLPQQRQVGKLQYERSDPASQPSRNRPSRHLLLDGLGLTSISNRSTNARFCASNNQHQHGMAEISVQHCSFYEVQKAITEPREKCLRIHLRLTTRPIATTMSAQKIWPTNERTRRLVHRILEIHDITSMVNGTKRVEENKKKLPGKLKLPDKLKFPEAPKETQLPSLQPLIFTNTSVKLIQEKLKRQQKNAELQSLRGNLKRVPRTRVVSQSRNDEEKSRKKRDLEVPPQKHPKNQKRRKIIKKKVVRKKRPDLETSLTSTQTSAQHSKNNLETPDVLQIPPSPASISQCTSSSSVASIHRSGGRSKPLLMNKKFMYNWERRILEEFKRHVNIPVLNAIYRQIFCLKCKICPTLGAPKHPPRAHFVRRNVPHQRTHLSDLSGSQILRLMSIFRPSVAQLTRVFAKPKHRPKQFASDVNEDPFGVSLKHVNKRQRPWIPYDRRKPKQFVPRWRKKHCGGKQEEDVEEDE